MRQLGLSYALHAPHLPSAEQLDHADLAHLPPVLPVGCEDDPLATEADHVQHRTPWSAGEDGIIGLHHLHCSLRGGADDGGHLTEPEQHQWAMLACQAEQGMVRG